MNFLHVLNVCPDARLANFRIPARNNSTIRELDTPSHVANPRHASDIFVPS